MVRTTGKWLTAREAIESEAAQCDMVAREQGYDGDGYCLTEDDCDWIARVVKAHIGRAPTHADWVDAGFPGIGGRHYEN